MTAGPASGTTHESMRESSALELPIPSRDARAHHDRVVARIRAEIDRHGGSIPFDRYMELALYDPGLGYYAAGLRKFGSEGDFMTAPEISPLFSRCLARPVGDLLESLGGGTIFEVGAGQGSMAVELLRSLEGQGMILPPYQILERSAALRAVQRALIDREIPSAPVTWLEDFPPHGFRGVVLANELLDSFPVRLLQVSADASLVELSVGWESGRFTWQRAAHERDEDRDAVRRIERDLAQPFPPGYLVELGPSRAAWVREVIERLEAGVVLLFDYGYPRREYYHPQRGHGTLLCYYRHRVHSDPLILAGLQDITAHVEFTSLAEAARAAGAEVVGFTTQASFLLSSGLAEMMPNDPPGTPAYLAASQQVKQLTLPGQMGDLVKVMALARGFDPPLTGFSGLDLRARLGLQR